MVCANSCLFASVFLIANIYMMFSCINDTNKSEFKKKYSNIHFVHYDSPFADRDFLEKVKKADSSKTSLFIIEEAHKFIINVYKEF